MKKAFTLNSKMIVKILCLPVIILLLGGQCNNSTEPGDCLLIANLERGSDPINSGGKLQLWNYGDLLQVTTGYYDLGNNTNDYGRYAAFVTLSEPATPGTSDWSGGGLVIVFKDDESAIDLTEYTSLEFDVKVIEGSVLNTTRVKLENSGSEGIIYTERQLSDYGVTFSTEWETVRIPVVDFTTLWSTDQSFWTAPDLTIITKFVTVSVRDNNAPNTQGTLLIDNIQFIK